MRLKRAAMVFVTAALSAAVLAGCAGGNREEAAAGGADEESCETGDASMDNPRNQDGIGGNELLAVSFGTSYNDSRRISIGAVEEALEKAIPDYSLRRAFTSQIIIDRVKSRDGVAIDNVGEALERAVKNGVKRLVIQPTHLMNGLEYTDLVNEAAEYTDAFEAIAVGAPLLTSDEDFKAVIRAITESTAEYDNADTAVCFMGHGTEAESNQVYAKMQDMLAEEGFENYFVGTVEAEPDVQAVLKAVQAGEYKKVVLAPLMIVAGDHAVNDMAGDDEDSWKSVFEGAGYEVTCLIRGLGELEGIRQIFVAHARAAISSLER
ncbi:sirohydrochlorin cobaltochelatase [Clostridiaceae bacterium]|jgi:sirohydrochlorin cobaltochelatase|nr:sirohydrochlorin cobaltochelatase [Clostridium sp.]NBI70396.1 sirohydrochlorin cobaltochelatase [Clostridiaceae bacterium]